MPYIDSIPKKALLNIEAGDPTGSIKSLDDDDTFDPVFTGSLLYLAKPKGILKRVRLTTGEKFSDLESNVILRRSETANAETQSGRFVYVPAFDSKDGLISHPASCQATVDLPGWQFDFLTVCARQGRAPSLIRLDVVGRGIKYGWEPDGSGVDWDNQEHRDATIVHISFETPLLLPPDPDQIDEDRDAIAASAPTSYEQMAKLIALSEKLRGDLKTLMAIVIFVAALFGWRYL